MFRAVFRAYYLSHLVTPGAVFRAVFRAYYGPYLVTPGAIFLCQGLKRPTLDPVHIPFLPKRSPFPDLSTR